MTTNPKGVSVVDSGGETPGPIPNPEAKPTRADGTALGRVWESKLPPTKYFTYETGCLPKDGHGSRSFVVSRYPFTIGCNLWLWNREAGEPWSGESALLSAQRISEAESY